MDAINTQVTFNQLISELSSRLINSEPAETYECIEEVIEAFGSYAGADRCYVFEFDDAVANMTNTHEWVRDGFEAHIDDLQSIGIDDLPWFFSEIKTHQLLIINDVELLPPEAEAEKQEFKREHIKSVICVGIVAKHQLLGFVGCDRVKKKHRWTPEEVRCLKLVANIIANTLERQRTYAELIHTQRELEKANRRAFDERIHNEIQRSMREQSPLSLLIIDIDHFKSYNDHYGHLQGDQALKSVANALFDLFQRNTDFVARYGGEEFVAVVSATDRKKTEDSINHLLESVRALQIPHETSAIAPYLTVSVGGYIHTPQTDENIETLVEKMIGKADSALYRAKSNGRNKGYLDD
jgi:diguanylate cyclase (GGDEF)-like protein